ncbi:chemotaxis protein CheA [Halanaerobaculum tunisiense]
MDMDEFQELYASESREHLNILNDSLLMLENNPQNTEVINEAFRAAHSLKGMASTMGFDKVSELAHALENVMDLFRNDKLTVETEIINVLFAAVDNLELLSSNPEGVAEEKLERLIGELNSIANQEEDSVISNKNQSQAATDNPDLSKRLKSNSKIKVDVEKLDSLMNLVAELVIKRMQVESVGENYDLDELNKKLKPLSKVTTELQDAVMEMRMVPISQVFNRFPRLVRDLSQELDKDINLVIEGEETELDRTIIDEIGDPLVHMIRNAIDHGIEEPEEREQAGKPREGLVRLSAFHEGNNVVIQIEDDGAGIDPEVIKEKALEKGVVDQAELDVMSDQEIINLIFAAGFSTAQEVSDVSGRGVGMDIVRNKIESLNGSVKIDSKLGEGSTFTIKLPLTLSIIQGFLTEVADQKYLIPLEFIQEIVDVTPDEIETIRQEEVIQRCGAVIPLISLRDKLNKPEDVADKEEISTVIVEVEDDYYGLIVDSIIGQQEVVIKRINDLSEDIEKIAGGAILGDGNIASIINVEEITTV